MLKKLFVINHAREIPGLEKLDNEYYAGSAKYLMMTLLWPGQNPLLQYLGRSFIILNLLLAMIFQLFAALDLMRPPINWELAIQNFFEISFVWTMLTLYFLHCSIFGEMHRGISKAVNFWNKITDPDQKEIMINSSQFYRRIMIICRVTIFTSFTGFAISPVFIPHVVNYIVPNKYNLTPKLCTTANILFMDEKKYFFFAFLYTLFYMILLAVVAVCFLNLMIFFVSIILIRFKLLSFRLEKLSSLVKSDNLPNTESMSRMIYDEVRNIYQSHESTIKYFDKLQYVGKKLMMINSIYVFVGLSFTGTMILFSLSVKNYSLLTLMIISFMVVLFLAFTLAYFGQKIVTASDDIFYHCYLCRWYKFPSNAKPYIIMMMIRALKPCELNAGPFMILKLNYENFTTIVNTSVSYMTVMASLM